MPGVVVTLSSPFGRSRVVGELGARRLELHENFVRGAVKQLALLGEDKAARVAMEQRDAQLGFEAET